MNHTDVYALERHRMVEEQIAQRGLKEPRLLAAMEAVPRHLFVPEEFRHVAYGDHPLPIGFEQTISQPYIVALMINLLNLKGSERVLEVGTGSGYQAALLAHLAAEVHTVEIIPELAERSRHILAAYSNVHCHVGNGSLGWPESAPYDGILVAAAAPRLPRPLLEQLKDGGRLVFPLGRLGFQMLKLVLRRGDVFEKRTITGVAFVPLRGKYGWRRA